MMEAPQPIVFDTSAIDGTQLSLASPLSFGPAPSSDTNSSILSSQVFTFGQAPCDTTHIIMRETEHTDEVQIINAKKMIFNQQLVAFIAMFFLIILWIVIFESIRKIFFCKK